MASGVNNYGSGNKYYIDGVVSPLVHVELETLIPLILLTLVTQDTLLDLVKRLMDLIIVVVNTQQNVTTNGSAGSSGVYTSIQVTNSTATTLFYYCTVH